jgi:hypothetical protein
MPHKFLDNICAFLGFEVQCNAFFARIQPEEWNAPFHSRLVLEEWTHCPHSFAYPRGFNLDHLCTEACQKFGTIGARYAVCQIENF